MTRRFGQALAGGSLLMTAVLPVPTATAAAKTIVRTMSYTCQLPLGTCGRLPPKWHATGRAGTIGGTQTIQSIDLSYHYAFKASVYVPSNKPGVAKQCVLNYGEHLDASGGGDLGFYKKSVTLTVQTALPGSQDTAQKWDFFGSVIAHLSAPADIAKLTGSGAVDFTSIIDLAPSATAQKEPCIWGGPGESTVEGTITVTYRKTYEVPNGGTIDPSIDEGIVKRQ